MNKRLSSFTIHNPNGISPREKCSDGILIIIETTGMTTKVYMCLSRREVGH